MTHNSSAEVLAQKGLMQSWNLQEKGLLLEIPVGYSYSGNRQGQKDTVIGRGVKDIQLLDFPSLVGGFLHHPKCCETNHPVRAAD